ncbi:MAG TPA: hypothetical protein ENN17_10115 [bacterium]|nr:hypothetical protein [bacterium]
MARLKADESLALVAAVQPPSVSRAVYTGTRAAEMAPARREPPPGRKPAVSDRQISQQDMLANRLQTVNQNIGSVMTLGTDSRKPTEEATIAGSEPIMEDLPPPPSMPEIRL